MSELAGVFRQNTTIAKIFKKTNQHCFYIQAGSDPSFYNKAGLHPPFTHQPVTIGFLTN
jgi:hypothetical protein